MSVFQPPQKKGGEGVKIRVDTGKNEKWGFCIFARKILEFAKSLPKTHIFTFRVIFYDIFAKLYVRANPSQNSVWECGSGVDAHHHQKGRKNNRKSIKK